MEQTSIIILWSELCGSFFNALHVVICLISSYIYIYIKPCQYIRTDYCADYAIGDL